MKITLYGRIPSKKNSKQIVRWRIISSKAYLQWEKEQIEYLKTQNIKNLWYLKFSITCIFYMPDKRKSDLSNKFESIADLFVKSWLLIDDNYEVLNQIHLYYWWYDKQNPRCEIQIELYKPL